MQCVAFICRSLYVSVAVHLPLSFFLAVFIRESKKETRPWKVREARNRDLPPSLCLSCCSSHIISLLPLYVSLAVHLIFSLFLTVFVYEGERDKESRPSSLPFSLAVHLSLSFLLAVFILKRERCKELRSSSLSMSLLLSISHYLSFSLSSHMKASKRENRSLFSLLSIERGFLVCLFRAVSRSCNPPPHPMYAESIQHTATHCNTLQNGSFANEPYKYRALFKKNPET